MQRGALVLALALTLPLVLYAVPYAYAATTSSTYVVSATDTGFAVVNCNAGDYATGGGADGGSSAIIRNKPMFWDGVQYNQISTGQPNAWLASAGLSPVTVWVICQTPLTVAGVTVPEFGSLYVAIALGAVVYFMLTRRFTRKPTSISAPVAA